VLPFTIPVLIFGVSAIGASADGFMAESPAFTILCARALASVVIGPFAAAAALRHGLE
jgi:heme exporter protein B